MYRKIKELPPLSPLPAFEASARLLSFTRAGEELFVSQAAVSQQIRVLESNLGLKLFERGSRQIKLTDQGQKFQHTVSVALGLLEIAAKEIRDQKEAFGLTIAADISMAHMWLLPRFSLFRSEFPDIDVSILASEKESDCLKQGVDLALLYGNGSWEGFDAHMLIKEEVFPVCSPAYLDVLAAAKKASDIELTLLDLKPMRWDWVDWRQLLSLQNPFAGQKTRYYQFNSLPLLTQAVLKGQGIGLGWKSLADDYIRHGELVKPFDFSLTTNRGYYALRPATKNTSVEADQLFEWIINHSIPD